MKKNSLLMIAAMILMTACGTMAQQSATSTSSRFEDGIYSSGPSFRSKVERQESKAETDALVEKTKASKIYLFGEKKDTVMIPDDMSASIWYDKEKGSTVVDVGYNPYDWRNNIDPWSYYTPYSIGSSWYWSRHYDPWYSSPWYWNSWAYTPYRYYGWYDPFYIGGWYDPWYYGYGGWYGGWDPYWGYYPHHHYPIYVHDDNWHGSRHSTGADRVFTSRVSTRGGIATASRTGRTATVSSASRAQATGTASVSRVPSRTSASRVTASTPSRVSASKVSSTAKPATVAKPVSGSKQNYRRPSSAVSGYTGTASDRTPSSASSYRSPDSQSYRSSGSSYRSSSSSSSSRSSYSTSSSSRSSYSSGSSYSGGGSGSRSGGSYSGGGSRSGGSSSGRR